jgi:hypothetical protein
MAAGGDLVDTVQRVAAARPALDVRANLSVSVDGTDLAVSSEGDRLVVQVPSVGAALGIARREGDRLPELSRVLTEAGLTAEVRIGSAVVALVGADAAPSALAELLSLGPVEIRPLQGVAAALRLR